MLNEGRMASSIPRQLPSQRRMCSIIEHAGSLTPVPLVTSPAQAHSLAMQGSVSVWVGHVLRGPFVLPYFWRAHSVTNG